MTLPGILIDVCFYTIGCYFAKYTLVLSTLGHIPIFSLKHDIDILKTTHCRKVLCSIKLCSIKKIEFYRIVTQRRFQYAIREIRSVFKRLLTCSKYQIFSNRIYSASQFTIYYDITSLVLVHKLFKIAAAIFHFESTK